MAIERIEGAPKVEWTAATLAQLGAAAVLVIVSFVLFWFAFSNWRFKENLIQGYQEYDRGQARSAKQELEAALSWRPRHAGARELLAKVLCDEGKLDDSRRHYLALSSQGFTGPELHVGLGVLALKEAQTADSPKAAEAKIAEAEAEYRKAAGVPEAEVGLGHCELLRALKLNDPSHEARAQVAFNKIRTAMTQSQDFRAGITRDGLIDYYAGVGKALSLRDTSLDGALEAFRACFQYTGNTWGLPLSNVLALESRRFAQFSGGTEGLLKLAPELNSLRNMAGTFWRSTRHAEERDEVREPWFLYSLSVARAWGRAGNVSEMNAITRDLQSSPGLEQRLEPLILDAQVRTELALREDVSASAQESAVAKAIAGNTELFQRLVADEARLELRARAINNIAWGLAWRGGYANNENLVVQAQQRLMDAVKLFPDDYVYNRNMAVILKRIKKPPASPQAFLARCRAAAEKDPDLAADLEKVERYLDSK